MGMGRAIMAKVIFKGISAYVDKLENLRGESDNVIGRAVYDGAAVVADAIRKEVDAIPIVQNQRGTPEHPIDGVTRTQKKGLQDGFGISPVQNDRGFINVKLGFAGYNKTKTKKYPQGQPNALIARAVNSGTSFRKKRRFVDKAVTASRVKAENAMGKSLDDNIEKIMK